MKILLNWILFIVVLLITIEEAYAKIPNRRELSLEECIYVALKESNAIRIQNYTEQINHLNLASSIHSTNPSFSMSLSPTYNQNISSITQPDGSIKNISVQHVSGLISFNASIPILLTGGILSLTQSGNYYRYINGNASYDNVSINLYQVSYSQPLSFFRRNKFIRQTAISNYNIKLLKKYDEIFEIKKSVIDCYFEILLAQENVQLFDSITLKYERIKQHYDALYKAGRCLLVDLDLLLLEIEECNIAQNKYKNHKNIKINELYNILSIKDALPIYFTVPLINKLQFNKKYLHARLDSIHHKYKLLIETATAQQLAEAKTNMIDLPVISLSVGNNTSFESPSQFKANLKPSYNISISYSTSLTDLKEKKRKKRMALLNKEIFIEEFEMKRKRESVLLDEIIDNIDICYDELCFLHKTYYTNLHSLELKVELLKAQKITLIEFNEQMKSFIKIKTKIINNTKDYFLYISQLECLLQFDYLSYM